MAGDDAHYYEPHAGHGLAHDPLNSIIAPRPIGWVSSLDRAGRRNLAPYSFFNAFNYRPPIIGFSSTGWKDSVSNLEATREFCWNLVTRDLAEQMNATSASVPPEVDEFAVAGLTPAASRLVSAPRVEESPVNFECRVTQILRLRTKEGHEVETWLVLGEVVAVHIDRSLIDHGIYRTTRAHPVVRGGGPGDYAEIKDDAIFFMQRPQ
jgi:flavin reductase (DIM6/NTAB) family NADH-FMN oxidoreductase RutF